MRYQLRFGRYRDVEIGPVGNLRWSTVATGGLEEITWSMPLGKKFAHPGIRPGTLIRLQLGTSPLGAAILASPEQTEDGWDFTAIGLYDDLHQGYLCEDSGGNTTSVADVAIDQAIADGFPVKRPASISSAPYAATEQTDELNYLADLLDAVADEKGKRWRITPKLAIVLEADPGAPDYYLLPGGPPLAIADDDYFSRLALRYKPTATTYATVHVDSGAPGRRVVQRVDLTDLGPITSGKVTDIGNGLIAKGAARYAVTNAVNPTRYELVTPGGQPAVLAKVRGGQKVRQFGSRDPQRPALGYHDWIIGRTDYTAGSTKIQLTPDKLAERNVPDLLTAAGRR